MLKKKSVLLAALTALCCLAVALALGFGAPGAARAAGDWESREQPALVITGTEIVTKPATTSEDQAAAVAASLANEKAYTMDELKAMTQTERVYSTMNSGGTRKQYLASGVDLNALLLKSGFNLKLQTSADVTFASGAYQKVFSDFSATPRYRFPNQAAGSEAGKVAVDPLIALKTAISADNSDAAPAAGALKDLTTPTLTVGATDFNEMNNSSFIRELDTIIVGGAVTANKINIFGVEYTRAQLLGMERVTATYSYITKAGDFTDTVRGIALADLVRELDDGAVVTISYTDGYTPTKLKASDLKDTSKRYMLALEVKKDGKWTAIYNVKNGFSGIGGIFYGAEGSTMGSGPLVMIAGINTAGDELTNSAFKHMTYVGTADGATYAPDAITGATLTVEGPGVAATTPIRVSELETTANDNLHRGSYTDARNGQKTTLLYEGVRIQAIVSGLVNDAVAAVSDDIQVVFKNRWRQDVCVIKYSDIVKAQTPVILAYGTGSLDGKTAAPFVYDNQPGVISSLGNDDGGLKLVYDAADFSGVKLPSTFTSVAYIYVEFTGGAPGYKHSGTGDPAYSNVENTEYLVTLVGSALGREVNLTVSELENMVSYDSGGKPTGIGYRAEYNLSNTTYWYVNTYEGVKLWDLLVRYGLDAAAYKNDDATLVTFSAWDNYKTTAAFSMRQLANPNLFYYYEKSPVDIGTDRPTKEELSLQENQPDNQVGAWTKDANGYPVKSGYPVLISYGVNGYPYVRSATMDGYLGGLGNDGGPVRVIFGKADNMNRSNAADITNYAYFYNNGSNQMQRAEEVYVGEEIRYSTHTENPATAYQDMLAVTVLTVEIVQDDGAVESKTFTLEQLEDILYGADVDKADRDKENRQEKAYYQYAQGKDDLFEGVNLWYLLSEAIGMQGSLGTASFYSGADKLATLDLDTIKASGGNSLRSTSGLEAMVAFAKNGYPLVAGAESAGYVGVDSATGISVENSGGPLALVAPQYGADYAAGAYVPNLTRIVVNLEADEYAHIKTYASYGGQTVAFTGAVSKETSLKISDIEKMQKYMVTDAYTVGGKQYVFRGVDLHALLNDPTVSASAMAETVTISNDNGQSVTLSAADLASGIAGKKVILAYGVAAAEGASGLPLVPAAGSAGYSAAFGNSGGVMRLVYNNGAAADCVANVSKISITAAEATGWTHTYGYYEEYLNTPILRITGDGVADPVTFTVGQLESLANEKMVDSYKLVNPVWFEGVDLYKLLMNYVALTNPGVAPDFTAYAKDAYSTAFKASDLTGGINGQPIILAYGQGATQADGLPLVDENTSNGYDAKYDNAYGPIRLIVNDNTGWCVKWLRCIVVGNGSYEDPAAFADDLADIEVTAGGGNGNAGGGGGAIAGQYVVQPGDYLMKIAREQLGDALRWYEIYKLNKNVIRDPNFIYPGQILLLPEK